MFDVKVITTDHATASDKGAASANDSAATNRSVGRCCKCAIARNSIRATTYRAASNDNRATANSLPTATREDSARLFIRHLIVHNVSGQVLAILGLVERTIEAGNEEHEHLSAHTKEQHEVGTRQVGQFKECTKDHD